MHFRHEGMALLLARMKSILRCHLPHVRTWHSVASVKDSTLVLTSATVTRRHSRYCCLEVRRWSTYPQLIVSVVHCKRRGVVCNPTITADLVSGSDQHEAGNSQAFAFNYHGSNGKRGRTDSHCDYLYVQLGLLWSTLTCFVTDVRSLHLPEILKPGFRATPRRLYAVLSIEDSPDNRYEMSSLDPEAYVSRPMTLWVVLLPAYRIHLTLSSLSKPSAKLNIELFAKRSHHDDILLAQTQLQVDTFDNDEDFEGLSFQ